MVLRIYLILFIVALSSIGIIAIFNKEADNREERHKKIGIIGAIINVMKIIKVIAMSIFALYTVFVLIYGIITLRWYLVIPSAGILLMLLFDLLSDNVQPFNFLTSVCCCVFAVIGFVSLIAVFLMGFMSQMGRTNIEKYVSTIAIEEFKQVGYANVSGGRWYIKTTPSEAYYYEVKTSNGGKTTKHIDGAKSYVEKFEDDQYASNPHIDVYSVERHYTNWYDEEITVMEGYSYYIYIPSNSILFYDEQ